MRVYAGVDCGATNLRVGIVDEKGKILGRQKTPSPLRSYPYLLAAEVKKQLETILVKDDELITLGVGTPGPLDLEKGWILPSANIRNQQPINLRQQFETVFTVPILFDRDTNIALLGEAWQGAAVGKKDVVMLTLGSGVGGALMINGEIERGVGGKAGEIGHMFLEISNRPRCGLGHEGCFEALLNSTKDLNEFATYLGYGLANIVDIFNPEMIIIGGGKIAMGDFLPKAIAVMRQRGIKGAIDEVEVVYAKLGEWSGVYGGAKLAHDSS